MSQRQEVMDRIRELRLVAVVRSTAEQVRPVVEALLDGGVQAIEITFTVPRAAAMIRQVAQDFGQQALLGAGTVVDAQKAADAIDAGARYVVAPNTDFETIGLCAQRDVAVVPGAFTPTEVCAAWKAGADCVKLFPAGILGIPYLKALRAPLPDVPIMPTGGVDASNAADWLRAGAVALGVGSKLVLKDALASSDYARITEAAETFRAAIAEVEE
ncbi:MAG: bifunctional 4-hydroxy-2-oxoglutarate aldolase/2-dehydro-3-deoxy-phosphogluconate aldolase [Candidatus Brocadiia bacterium]